MKGLWTTCKLSLLCSLGIWLAMTVSSHSFTSVSVKTANASHASVFRARVLSLDAVLGLCCTSKFLYPIFTILHQGTALSSFLEISDAKSINNLTQAWWVKDCRQKNMIVEFLIIFFHLI